MSHSGRAFRDIGKKMLSLIPLSRQRVNADDSVLGPLAADAGASPGLTTTYDAMLRQAFKPEWWNSSKIVRVAADGTPTVADRPTARSRATSTSSAPTTSRSSSASP